jgi:DNA-binding SARP family transcriptional activator/tetratricopeptide (TPR) repeat protein
MHRHIHLLGTLSITDDDRPSELLRNAKGCALLTYLLVRGRSVTREHLADLLWDVTDTASSLRNLRVLLTRIRPYLPRLDIARQTLRYQPHPAESVDYLALAASLNQRDTPAPLAALRLYQGELLDGLYLDDAPRFMEWLTLERERLRRTLLDAHRSLCQTLAADKRWQDGAEAAAHWLLIDNLDEEALRWQLQFLAATGQVSAALRAFAAYRQRLWDELGVEPEAATQALVQELAEWSGSITAISLPDLSPLEALTSGELSDPGPLPATSILPYHRNVDFVGREADLLQIAASLGKVSDDGRGAVVAITGIGGLGKTQTAVELCYRYGRYFPGGVFWLNFGEAQTVAEEVAAVGSERGLGLFGEAEQLTLADQIRRVQRAWQEPIARLLIFDNCEDEGLVATWSPVTGGCRVVLTSRQGEWERGLGVTAVALNVLDPRESGRLLQRLAAHVSEAEAAAIAREVGHLPLALHLAGSFLRRYRQISPASYIAQVQDKGLLHHPSFQGRGASHSPTGHELSVARTYALSWERLDEADEVDAMARQFIGCAACLAAGEPIPAEWLKATICRDSENMMMTLLAEDGLSRLITMGFLMRESAQMVVMHPLLALFTKTMSGEEQTGIAQMTVATMLAQTLSEYRQREGHLSTLPISAIHLRHVSDAAFTRKAPMAATLATLLGVHLMNIDENIPAEQVLHRAHAFAKDAGDVPGQARALYALSGAQENMGHDDESLASAQQAVELFKEAEVPDLAGLTEALNRKGWAHCRLGQPEAALRTAEEGYALSGTAQLRQARARYLSLMGAVNSYMLGNYEVAQHQLEEGMLVYRELGNRLGECAALNNIGENARLQGDYALAARYYEEALAIAREIENYNKVDHFQNNLCDARIQMGEFDAAATDLEELIAKTRHDWFGLSEAYRFLAEAYLGQGKSAQALAMAQQALALAYPSNLFENGRAWHVLGLVAAQLGEPIRSDVEDDQLYDASSCFGRSLAFFKDSDFKRDRAITLWRWAQHELSQGNKMQGQALWQEAQDMFVRLNLSLMVAQMETNPYGHL